MAGRVGLRVGVALLAGIIGTATGVGAGLLTATSAGGVTPTVEHWGAYISGGIPDQDILLRPTAVSLPGTVTQVASSNAATYTLLSDGTVYAWGIGDKGELGNGGTTDQFTTPVQVAFPAGVTIAKLADTSPYDTGLALDTSGHPWGWGLDGDGQLCRGNRTAALTPVEIPISHVTALAGAGDHALYVSGGNVSACGDNANGDLGIGTTVASTVPVAVAGLQSGNVGSVYASWRNSGALTSSGTYYSWGYNNLGNVGNGQIGTDAEVPQLISFPATVTHVALGGSGGNNGQTLVILSDGTLRSWGFDKFGQLGDGKTKTEGAPVSFKPPTGVTYATLASGGSTAYAVDTSGNVWSWGNNVDGQVGDGTTTNHKVPVMVLSGASRISTTAKDVVAY